GHGWFPPGVVCGGCGHRTVQWGHTRLQLVCLLGDVRVSHVRVDGVAAVAIMGAPRQPGQLDTDLARGHVAALAALVVVGPRGDLDQRAGVTVGVDETGGSAAELAGRAVVPPPVASARSVRGDRTP